MNITGTHSFRVQKIRRAYLGIFAGIVGFISYSPSSSAQNIIDTARQRTSEIRPQLDQQTLPIGINVGQQAVQTNGDLDLGIQLIMKHQLAEQPYRFFADVAGFYTNNVALTNKGAQGDSYLFGDVGFTYQKNLNDEFSVEATIRQAFFNYGTYNSLNFQDFNVGTGVTWQSKKLWDLSFFGRYNFERFTDGSISSDFFRNNTLTVGVQKTWIYSGNQYIYAGYSSVFGWADPYYSQRDEHGFYGGVHYNFTKHLYGEVYYRIAVFDYSIGRTDLNQTAVATVAYIINDYAKISASFSYVANTSNHSVYSYNALTTGGGLALQLKF